MSFVKNFNESFINFYFNFMIKNYCDNADQNFYNVVEIFFIKF